MRGLARLMIHKFTNSQIMADYDIFFSYRRRDKDGHENVDMARSFCYELAHNGFKVFFDFNECNDGYFSEKILPAVRTCDYFVLLLTKDTLERCKNEGDWVRREIEEALLSGRKIIPITPDGAVRSWPQNLPQSLKPLDGIQITSIHRDESFKSDMLNLINNRLSDKKHKQKVRRAAIMGGTGCVVIALAVLAWASRGDQPTPEPAPLLTDTLLVDTAVTPAAPTVQPTDVDKSKTKEKDKKSTNSSKDDKTSSTNKSTNATNSSNQKGNAVTDQAKGTTEKVNHRHDTSTVITPDKEEMTSKSDDQTVKPVDPVPPTPSKPKVNKDYSKGVSLMNARNWAEALKALERAKAQGAKENDLDSRIKECRNQLGI